MDGHFAWQAWRLATWTVTLHGKRGPYGTGLALVGRLGPSWRRGRRSCLRGRRGAWRHRPSLCVAGVALGDIHAASESSLSNTTLSHTHNFVTHNLSHTSLPHATSPSHLCHAQFCHTHTQLCRAQLFHTQLCHKQLCHTQLCHTQLFHTHNFVTDKFVTHNSFTHNFVTIFHNYLFTLAQLFVTYNFLSYTIFHTHLCHRQLFHTHTTLSQAIFHTTLHIQLLKLLILHHLHCPFCFFRAASATFSDYWMKLTCGIIRPFNYQYRSTLSHFL